MRKKKRRFYSFTVSLTMEQIEFLQNRYPSASQYVRALIDKDMGYRKESRQEIIQIDRRIHKLEWDLGDLEAKAVDAEGGLCGLGKEDARKYRAEMRKIQMRIEELKHKKKLKEMDIASET